MKLKLGKKDDRVKEEPVPLQWSWSPDVNSNFLEGEDNTGMYDHRRAVDVFKCRICERTFLGYETVSADESVLENKGKSSTHICVSALTGKPFGVGIADLIGVAFLAELEESIAEEDNQNEKVDS